MVPCHGYSSSEAPQALSREATYRKQAAGEILSFLVSFLPSLRGG